MQRCHGLARIRESLLPRQRLARAQQGLFHGRITQHGDHVSYSMHRTKRTWKPNVFWKTFNSVLLDHSFQVRVTAKALRCIDKAGGIDNYVLFTKEDRMDSKIGEELKHHLVRAWEEKNLRPFNCAQIVFERKKAEFERREAIDAGWMAEKLEALRLAPKSAEQQKQGEI